MYKEKYGGEEHSCGEEVDKEEVDGEEVDFL
jgi:hypothetical protein